MIYSEDVNASPYEQCLESCSIFRDNDDRIVCLDNCNEAVLEVYSELIDLADQILEQQELCK